MEKPAFDPSKPFQPVGGLSGPKPAFDPSQPFQTAEPGLLESAVNGIAKVGKAIDSVTGAPTRAAIAAAQNGDFLGALPAFAHQFADDPDKAPTGHDLALKAGLSDKHAVAMTGAQRDAIDAQNDLTFAGPKPMRAPNKDLVAWSPADVGGAALTVAADPTLALPVIGESKLLKNATRLGGEGVQAAVDAVKNSDHINMGFPSVENRAAIEAAAKNLGIKDVPKALLTSNPTYQQLESGLAQSGSIPAKGVRDQYNNFFKSLEDASKKISDLKTADSDFASGSKIQSDMAKQVSNARAPVSQMYEDLTPHLKKIEVNEDVVNKAFGALKRNPIFQNQQGRALLEEYKASTLAQPELSSLKEFRSTLSDSLSKTAAPLDEKRMDAIASTVTSIRDNTIHALKEHMPADLHPEVDKLIDDISLADAAHGANVQDINSVKGIVSNKDFKSPVTFLDKLGDMKEGDVAQKAANLDVGSLKNLQDKFPTVFEKAKAARINDMIQSSTNPISGFNDASFLKKYQGLDKEMKDLIFTPEIQSHIDSLQTVKQAIPEKLGPSGTPGGQMMMDMFNPKRNALDLGVKVALNRAAKPAAGATEAAPKSELLGKLLTLVPRAPGLNSTVAAQSALKVADKGPAKWANDGAEKLITHSPEDKQTIEKARGAANDNPKVKALLIQASDLKPGSAAMQKTIEKLKSKIASGDE